VIEVAMMFVTVIVFVWAFTAPVAAVGFAAGYISGRWKKNLGGIVKEVDLLIDQPVSIEKPKLKQLGRPPKEAAS